MFPRVDHSENNLYQLAVTSQGIRVGSKAWSTPPVRSDIALRADERKKERKKERTVVRRRLDCPFLLCVRDFDPGKWSFFIKKSITFRVKRYAARPTATCLARL
jgi:hypothetical protein